MKMRSLLRATLGSLVFGALLFVGLDPNDNWSWRLAAAPTSGVHPATEQEWFPAPSPAQGAVEQTLLEALPPTQSLKPAKSLPSAQSIPTANSDLLLPSEPSSLNLNLNVNAAPKPAFPVVLPTVAAVPEPDTNPMLQPEDATMKGIKSAMWAIMGAALLSTPAAAEPKDELTKAIDRLDAAVKRMEDVEKNLNAKVKSLEEEIRQLKLATNPTTTSKRETTGDFNPKMGRVTLTNAYLNMMSVDVNGVRYDLFPNETRSISVTPGAFVYQVWGAQPVPVTRTIDPGMEKVIRIFPVYP